MTAVAFAATKIAERGPIAPGCKETVYKITLPTAAVAAGLDCDLSADFNYVQSVSFMAHAGYTFDLTATYDSTNKGLPAASLKFMAYYSDYNGANDGPLIAVPDNTDLSAVAANLTMTVRGK